MRRVLLCRAAACLLAAVVIHGHVFAAAAILKMAGAAGVAQLGRDDFQFNFQDGPPGVDGMPFRIENVYGPRGPMNLGDGPPTISGNDAAITADYAGRLSVTIQWSKGAAPAEANRVYADVTITNRMPEPVMGYTLDLVKLQFPTPPAANNGNPNLRAYNTGSPGIFFANYGGPQPGALACDLEGVDATEPLLMKLERASAADVEGVLKVMNHHDYEDNASPWPWWPVPAGGTVRFRIGLRFLPLYPDPNVVCADLFEAFARRYPVMDGIRNWTDRRPIAQVFLAGDNPNGGRNPREWFDATARVDVTTPGGVRRFQKMVFARAHDVIKRMKEMGAQGVITWDIEGSEFRGAFYMGDPTKLGTDDPTQSVAPELAAIADQYFKMYRDAGYRVGVTIRPQEVVMQRDGAGNITNATENEDNWDWKSDPPANLQAFWQHQLEMKIAFARRRWGATLFYIDSNGDPNSPVSFLVMRNLAAEFPDVLLIPEQSTMGYYSAAAPYRQLDMLAANNIVSPVVRRTYPGPDGRSPCFAVINPTLESMTRCWPQLVQEVREGDILFFRAWYDAPELPAIRQVYSAARRR